MVTVHVQPPAAACAAYEGCRQYVDCCVLPQLSVHAAFPVCPISVAQACGSMAPEVQAHKRSILDAFDRLQEKERSNPEGQVRTLACAAGLHLQAKRAPNICFCWWMHHCAGAAALLLDELWR